METSEHAQETTLERRQLERAASPAGDDRAKSSAAAGQRRIALAFLSCVLALYAAIGAAIYVLIAAIV